MNTPPKADSDRIIVRRPTTHVKSKIIAGKAKHSRQKQNDRVKSQTVASKAKQSRQKQNSRINIYFEIGLNR